MMGLDDVTEIGLLRGERAPSSTLEHRDINGLFHRPCAPALLPTLGEVSWEVVLAITAARADLWACAPE